MFLTKREIESALRRGGVPPGNCEQAAHAPVQPMEVHDYCTRQPRLRRRGVLLLALCLLLALGAGGFYCWDRLLPYSTLALGGGPAFLLRLNRHDTVLTVEPVDEDARVLLEGRSYRDWDYQAALAALVDDLERAGYLAGTSPTVTAESSSPDRARVLELDAQQFLQEKLDAWSSVIHPAPEPPTTVPPTPEPSATPPEATPGDRWQGHHGNGYGGGRWRTEAHE